MVHRTGDETRDELARCRSPRSKLTAVCFVCSKLGVPVSLEINIETKFTGDHEHGFNTIAEIQVPIQNSKTKW